MVYDVKKPILGFEDVLKVELNEIDGLFSTVKAVDKEVPNFTVVNPYQLREYSFDIPKDVQVLLDIKEDSKLLVYNIVVLHNPITESVVNFKAPLIFNQDNHTMAQFVIEDEVLLTIGELLKNRTDASN
ncbi:MAG: flagellar assembly protein FliW [Epsilonproteobacteria bacterium]|nr:flagellar assembly protein FliW [Campylobacterota bacterium]